MSAVWRGLGVTRSRFVDLPRRGPLTGIDRGERGGTPPRVGDGGGDLVHDFVGLAAGSALHGDPTGRATLEPGTVD